MVRQKILVTGGLGFIGSHTVVELSNAGYQPVIVDNLVNSELFILDRIQSLTGRKPIFYPFDLRDKAVTKSLFSKRSDIQAVIHFAAHKAVGESTKFPLKYFTNNIGSLLNLLEGMNDSQCARLVFSSSATVYGQPDILPVLETAPFKAALSAYGSTKQMGEEILEKVSAAENIKSISLRYFNPAGAHPSALIGELPRGIPNNLMPFVTQAAIGKLKELVIYGNDYNTQDGTCVRDYVHVIDLAKAHVKACELLLSGQGKSFNTFNIGTGNGTSVLEVIKTFERVNQVKVPYRIGNRREGDAEKNYANVYKANSILGWKAELTIEDMVRDAWRWQKALGNN